MHILRLSLTEKDWYSRVSAAPIQYSLRRLGIVGASRNGRVRESVRELISRRGSHMYLILTPFHTDIICSTKDNLISIRGPICLRF